MPFTISHIAAVLPASRVPALRDPLALSALTIGAMSPDVPYFIPARFREPIWSWTANAHTWEGMVTFCVPVTVLLVAVYWLLLAAPLRALSPHGVRARLPRGVLARFRGEPGRAVATIFIGATIGAATHILWDAFTHEGRFGVMAVPWLQLPHLVGPLPAYRVLQYASSVIGLALVLWSLVRWYRSTPASAEVPIGLGWRWQLPFVGAVATAGVLAWWSVRDLALGATTLYDVRDVVTYGLTRSIAFMALVVLVGALAARVPMQRLEAVAR